ncbi:carbon starvation protein A, partial [bacterium]|nr:carbon starvation protein A [bacterium]
MQTVLIAAGAFVAYLVAYQTYGKYLARRIFDIDDSRPTPAHTHRDDVDFCPSRAQILFGHHFTSIAGTGPIVGPAIAIIWGWVPALVWVLVGAIFMGAVHDFGALVISARHQGRTIGDVARDIVNGRVRFLFLVIIFFTVLIVIAIFCLVIANLFALYPAAVFPVWIQIPIAMVLGWMVYRKGISPTLPSLVALVLLYA